MTSASMTFGRPARRSAPRFGHFMGHMAASLIQSLRRMDQWQLNLKRREPQTAEEVMAWASAVEASEPGFASDLRAAALRSMGKADR